MSAQTVSTCVVCGAQTDAFLCGNPRARTGCLGKLLNQLNRCGALVNQLNLVLTKRVKTGGTSVGYISSGGEERPLPVNLRATEVEHWLRDRLCSWASDLWESNAARLEDGSIPLIDLRPELTQVALWLIRHPSWIALHPAADELYHELMDDMREAWKTAYASTPRLQFVGRCYAVLDDVECTEALYAYEDSWTAVCAVCGTEHEDLDARWEEMAGCAEDQYVPINVLVGLVTERGAKVSTSTVRNLRARNRVTAWVNIPDGGEGFGVEDQYGNRVRVQQPEDSGLQTLYRLGDVLDAITNRYKHLKAA